MADFIRPSYAPSTNDDEQDSLKKINALLLAQAAGGAGSVNRGTPVNKSGTSNGASQTVAEAKADRGYFSFQNPSGNSGTFWVDPLGGVAAAGSPRIEVKPGQGFVFRSDAMPVTKITAIGTSGEKWTAYEF